MERSRGRRKGRSRGQHLRDSVHGGNPSPTSSLPDSIKDDYRCPITRPDTGGKDGESYKLCLHGINNSMTVVTGRVIIPPSLKLDGNLSVEGKPVEHWAILDFTGDEHGNITNFIEALRHKFTSLGINMEQPLKIFKLENSDSLGELLSRIKTINGRRLQLLLCIMSKNNKVYKLLKFLAETEIGIVTQCCRLTPYNARSGAFLTSLAHKINVKMGGRNVDKGLLPFFDYEEHVMLVGADVNHPASKDCSGSPSIAAVVATVNWPATNKYASRISIQEGHCEKISNFGAICFDLVGNYEKLNNSKPKKIIVFRDGVSRGEFSIVLNEELEDLKRVFRGFNYHPTITVVVAVKGHRTHFFPMSPKDGDVTSNVLPGTVVDTLLTDPSEFVFFLYSQSRMQTTSKPMRYHVLWDENKFSSDELQRLIYALCFSSPRCNEAVRLIPPVHYADLAAYRGRQYFDAMVFSQPIHSDASSSSSTFSNPNVPQFLKLHPDMENLMYFV